VSADSPVMNCNAIIDWDGDGHLDVLESNDFGPNRLLHNDAGKGFTDILPGMAPTPYNHAMGTAIADYDRDGTLDFYMVDVSRHWSQRSLFERYYALRSARADGDRDGEDARYDHDPIGAYQMNWKGENFYTSNKIPAYVSSGANFTTWVKSQRDKGTKVMFFVTEHSRTGGLRSEVGAKSYREVTDKDLCNKFVLVRAEL
jgi:hypothetical protein